MESRSFLELSNEIRVRIYKILLYHQRPLEPIFSSPIRRHFKALSDPATRLDAGLNSLLACKSINGTCCSILYGNNTFHLRSRQARNILKFLISIGPSNRSNIRKMIIDFECIRTQPGVSSLNFTDLWFSPQAFSCLSEEDLNEEDYWRANEEGG